eukprot:CAMPEP_0171502340 /NCGR_PEP_ID=MMETSP0958-20121227/10112_1 /TAXON_ID=87120 /ORGANISM="Aurantiochytrium limacinum, Strain ATCCMYA-1381" /LENGTH=72 /DNA_ID=CAMNT_0012037361 /DNA_START=268 /DNA_END=483 /DNA_ORIENTATION=-
MPMLYYTLGLNGRRYTEIILIVLFTVMGFAVADDIIQAAFVTLAGIMVTLLTIDYIFLDEASFKYDPDYANW